MRNCISKSNEHKVQKTTLRLLV